jgi:hypothetical protein
MFRRPNPRISLFAFLCPASTIEETGHLSLVIGHLSFALRGGQMTNDK